jgi:hypothetical protein
MNMHFPRADTPRRQVAVIAGKLLLILVVVALVVASIVQQHAQSELRGVQHQANAAHNDGACAMRSLTQTLIVRTDAALKRPQTRPEDKPGYIAAIAAYQHLKDAQVTVPVWLDCRVLLSHKTP